MPDPPLVAPPRPDGTARRLVRHGGARAGAGLALLVAAVALLGPLVVGDPDLTRYADQLTPPGAEHWLGTDSAGRDLLARTVAGTRTSLQAAVVVTALTTAIGLVVGGLAGYLGGLVDAVVSRALDVLLGLPEIIMALAIVGTLGPSHLHLVLALVLTGWASTARLTRSLTLGTHRRLDVLAARLAGRPPLRVFLDHVVPGTLAQVSVAAASSFGTVVLALAGLSFLGLGAQPPTAELGQMLADSQGDLVVAPWLAAGPAAVLVATVAAALLISDALRDALDPDLSPPARGRRRPRGAARRSRTESSPAPARVVAGTGPAPALVVRDLRVAYPDGTVAVDGVDLTVERDSCLALVGVSGCGKTTIVRAVLGLLPEGSDVHGTIAVDGVDVGALDEARWRAMRGVAVGYVAQDPVAACHPLHSVGRHVAEAWRAHGRRPPRATIAERVAALGVPDAGRRLRERPHTWSGGMLQRATIAAATAQRPVLTVADEPTSALDADLAAATTSTVRRASDALLLVTHDLRLVAGQADRVAVVDGGRIVEEGPTERLLVAPRHRVTRQLLAAVGAWAPPPHDRAAGQPAARPAGVGSAPDAPRDPA